MIVVTIMFIYGTIFSNTQVICSKKMSEYSKPSRPWIMGTWG